MSPVFSASSLIANKYSVANASDWNTMSSEDETPFPYVNSLSNLPTARFATKCDEDAENKRDIPKGLDAEFTFSAMVDEGSNLCREYSVTAVGMTTQLSISMGAPGITDVVVDDDDVLYSRGNSSRFGVICRV